MNLWLTACGAAGSTAAVGAAHELLACGLLRLLLHLCLRPKALQHQTPSAPQERPAHGMIQRVAAVGRTFSLMTRSQATWSSTVSSSSTAKGAMSMPKPERNSLASTVCFRRESG